MGQKKFIHKTLGWIAIECEKGSNYMIDKGGTGKFAGTICSMKNGIIKEYLVDKQLIENSSDREEIIENDWISQCVEEIFEYQRGFPYEDEPDYVSIRKIIQKHAPKQKKFTRNEVRERISREVKLRTNIDYTTMLLDREVMLCEYLKEHGLLLSDE